MTELYRPRLHFTPASGWMNDPNGLIRVDDLWHLFFQHDPDSTKHGPMHWGHAVSRDLTTWEERPIALRPDSLGTCFSGSAIRDGQGEITLFYTAHSVSPDGRDHQVQCAAHVDAALERFAPHKANPILDNPGYEVFRDPKVIWHAPTGQWVMLLTEGRKIGFYGSTDLETWTHLSSFGGDQGHCRGCVWECPDLLELPDGDGGSKWALIVSVSDGALGPGSGTQYFIGQFDGRGFINDNPPETVLWLDIGRDFYAPQSFFDPDAAAPLVIAWASNWTYARQTPTDAFRGAMSLPRRLGLLRTEAGWRLAHTVPPEVVAAFDASRDRATFRLGFNLSFEQQSDISIALFGEKEAHFRIRRNGERRLTLATRRAGYAGLPEFDHAYSVDFPWEPNRPLAVELFADRGLVELFCADGTVSLTNLFFPENPAGPMSIEHRGWSTDGVQANGRLKQQMSHMGGQKNG